jgi:predicted ATP-dependent protease
VRNLVLDQEVQEAVANGSFHLWAVDKINDALELLLGTPCGEPDADGNYPPDSIFGRVTEQLAAFNRYLIAAEKR